MKFFLSLFFISIVCFLSGQTFIKNTTNRSLTFKELQKQFEAYKKSNDLSKKSTGKVLKDGNMKCSCIQTRKASPQALMII